MQPSPRLLDPRLEGDLERDGYALIEDFLDDRQIERLRATFVTHDSPQHRAPFGATIFSEDLEHRSAIDHEIRAVLDEGSGRVFNGYRLCFTNFVSKAPFRADADPNAGRVMPHQDIAFVDEEHHQSLGIWVPLSDTDAESGCLSVVPGSHRFNRGLRGPGSPYQYRQLDDQFRFRNLPMKAGSATVFCQKLFHASPPNRTSRVRVAVGGLYAPHDAQLYCFYLVPGTRRMEMFAVDDDFYVRYQYKSRPEGVPLVGLIHYSWDTITAEQLGG